MRAALGRTLLPEDDAPGRGNVAVELAKLLMYAHRGRYHRKYADWRFWVARLLMVFIAGVMALAHTFGPTMGDCMQMMGSMHSGWGQQSAPQ